MLHDAKHEQKIDINSSRMFDSSGDKCQSTVISSFRSKKSIRNLSMNNYLRLSFATPSDD